MAPTVNHQSGAGAAAPVPPARVHSGQRKVRAPPTTPKVKCEQDPIAEVAVDMSLPHLDRPFDYLVPEAMDLSAVVGARVRVRFAGRLVDGFILRRLHRSEHGGRLGYLERVISPEPVLSAEVAALARAVADRYVGSLSDVLRLAIPPRHARAEASLVPRTPVAPVQPDAQPAAAGSSDDGWHLYPAGPAFLSAVARKAPARAIWQAVPGEDWAARLAEAAQTAHTAGHGALLLAPDARHLGRLASALGAVLAPENFVVLSADLGPAERYRRFLTIRRGLARVVAGTRAAAFAPVTDLALVAMFDDGDEMYAEPRAPYPHAREVLTVRSAAVGCALLIGGFGRTAEAQLLVESGWAREIIAARNTIRDRSPRIQAQGDSYAVGADSAAAGARLSPAAFAAARRSLQHGAPVLVQVPRRGYLPTLLCRDCRRPARCRRCHGPLGISSGAAIASCRWCGVPDTHFTCGACGGHSLRAAGQGARRTAEELGRAFPGIALVTSAGDTIRDEVPAGPAIVVATPGAEPVAVGGYGAALLLDGGSLLARADLRAAEVALRRWLAAATLVRPASAGGQVLLGVDASVPAAQALIRWDPAGHAAAELAGRRQLGFPPVVAMASLTGAEAEVTAAVDELQFPDHVEVLGPVPVPESSEVRHPGPEQMRVLLRTGQPGRRALAAALRVLAVQRSARKDAAGLRIQIDPGDAL